MRHNKSFNHLGRQSGHRKAMLSNMASSLIINKRIETTVAKAKALKMFVEPLVTKSKDDSTHSRRVVFSYLKDKTATAELFRTIAPKIADRPGGYLRVLHTGFRQGDGSEMALVEFVDFNEAAIASAPAQRRLRLPLQRLRLPQQKRLRQSNLNPIIKSGHSKERPDLFLLYLDYCFSAASTALK